MGILNIIENIIIGPLKLLFEIIFSISNSYVDNVTLSILILSLAMNFLVLPLYKRADQIQEAEKLQSQKLKPWVDHIKKTFKGDERFMMLQTLYRQNNYKPTNVLKSSVSLLLEIPFFIAAYKMLSGLELLNGVSCGPIKDLGSPDAMLVIFGITINFLPIIMTVINLISSIIYTKGSTLQSKIQLFGIALIFLILLYNSPSGLVLYWTLNNIFSLIKNVFYKLKNPKLILSISFSLIGVVLSIIGIINPLNDFNKSVFAVLFLTLLQIPILSYGFSKSSVIIKKDKSISALLNKISSTKIHRNTFLLGCCYMAVLTGLLIPTNVIKSSPEEFINTIAYTSPLIYTISSLSLAIGSFVFWLGIIYCISKQKGKKILEILLLIVVGTSTINTFVFGKDTFMLSPKLIFEQNIEYPLIMVIASVVLLLIFIQIFVILWSYKNQIIKPIYTTMLLALIIASSINMYNISTSAKPKIDSLKEMGTQELATIPLSKNGKNVIVLMMDRAISSHVPYLFNENPTLKEQFKGFTYYPNTISYGGATNYGSPGLFGGYEYTPKQMNKRVNQSLEEKHNESLKVMPVLFDNNDYEVTVCQPTYAGYDIIPDLSIYDDYPNIRRFNTNGKFYKSPEETQQYNDYVLNRNFFCYSLYRISPHFIRPTIYGKGSYNDITNQLEQQILSKTQAKGLNNTFMETYTVLQNLPNITDVNNTSKNTFCMMTNDTSHAPTLLQEPSYTPQENVDNTEFYKDDNRFNLDGNKLKMDNTFQITHYEVNMASMIQLGNWFDYLRENDVYNNTKIIIVSDHGYPLNQFDDMILQPYGVDIMRYMAFLMVKDFNSNEFTTNYDFMTNSDVPTLATKDLIDNPINPMTNNPISSDTKSNKEQYIIFGGDVITGNNNGNTFKYDYWLTLKNKNALDISNWDLKPHD